MWDLNGITSILQTDRGRFDTHIDEKVWYEDEGRDLSGAATSHRMPQVTRS